MRERSFGRGLSHARPIAALVLAVVVGLAILARPSASVATESSTPTSTRPVAPSDVDTFVEVSTRYFPALSAPEARCVAEHSLPHLALATIAGLMSGDQSPLTAPPNDRDALEAAIDTCVRRATAVAVLSRRALELAGFASPFDVDLFSYAEQSCVDERFGDVSPGSDFFALYERPATFQRTLGRGLGDCLTEDRLLALLGSWVVSMAASPLIATDAQGAVEIDPVNEACLSQQVQLHRADASELLAQAMLAQSPDRLGADELALVDTVFSACGLPVPRRGSV